MKNILITGAGGQLGNEMRALSAEHPEYRYFFTDVQELDISRREAVLEFVKQNEIDAIVNCAAYTAVDQAEDHSELCDRLNNLAPGYLAEAAAAGNALLIHTSTDYVFDGTNHLPYTENDRPCPQTVYGRTKLAGEENVRKILPQAVILRTAWLYSTFGNNFVKTMLRLGRERDRLGVVFDQIGTPTYARDLARAIYAILEKGGGNPGIYHFSNEGVCSWYDFAKSIHRLSGITGCRVDPLHTYEYPAKAQRPSYSVLDKTKIKETFGIGIPHWKESLKECIDILNKE